MRVALDSNVLLYAEGIDDAARRDAAIALIARLAATDIVVPVQAIGEVFNVLVRRGGLSRAEAGRRCAKWADAFETAGTTADILTAAIALAGNHALSIWDAVILQSASASGCRLLISEDMQDGFEWGGVTIVNPFAEQLHPHLAAALGR